MDTDRFIQLHLELHELGIRDELIVFGKLRDLDGLDYYKFKQLISKYPTPQDEPKLSDWENDSTLDKAVSEPDKRSLHRKKWRKWIAHRILNKLRSIYAAIERLEEKLRTESDSQLLYEDLEYQRELKRIIENWCYHEFGRIPPESGKMRGIRLKDQYPHLDQHKDQKFPQLAKQLIKNDVIDLDSIYPSGKRPKDPTEAKHLLEAFKHVVYHHHFHKKNKYSVVKVEKRFERN